MSTQYAHRDHRALGEHYLRHVSAMTGEGLHAKSDIAAELAWRDAEIERLRVRLVGKRAIFQAGRDSYKTNCQPMNTDDEAWAEFVASQEARP